MVYRKLKGLRSELEYEKKYLIIKPRERLKFKQIQLMLKKKCWKDLANLQLVVSIVFCECKDL